VTGVDGNGTSRVQCPCPNWVSQEQSTKEPKRNHLDPEHCARPFVFRRLRGDMNEVYKIVRGLDTVNRKQLYPLVEVSHEGE